jgi:hypothetical protein
MTRAADPAWQGVAAIIDADDLGSLIAAAEHLATFEAARARARG